MKMRAMVLEKNHDLLKEKHPLVLREIDIPKLGRKEILIRIEACGVCHTELDEIEGRTAPANFPIILGHEVVGTVEKTDSRCQEFKIGDRVGVGWIYSACGRCEYCLSGKENLCSEFKATGRDADGGYAEYIKITEDFAVKIPVSLDSEQTAPLLCAGGVGFRSLKLTNIREGNNLGLTGFGASGHLVLLLVKKIYPDVKVYVFARNKKEREFALDLGATWAGDTVDHSPQKLHAIIDTTPVWKPVVEALKNLTPGGRLVINAIRKENSDIDYLNRLKYHEHLWLEKEIKSVANVTRSDITEFLKLAAKFDLTPEVQIYNLNEANRALIDLKQGKIRGAKVLAINEK